MKKLLFPLLAATGVAMSASSFAATDMAATMPNQASTATTSSTMPAATPAEHQQAMSNNQTAARMATPANNASTAQQKLPSHAAANTGNAANMQNKTAAANDTAATVHMSRKDNLIYAAILVSQSENIPGTIKINWTAPQHSGCPNSSYELQYQFKTFHTRAYRTLVHNDAKGMAHTCAGTWTVHVMDGKGNVLADADFDVADHPVVASADNSVTQQHQTQATHPQMQQQAAQPQSQPANAQAANAIAMPEQQQAAAAAKVETKPEAANQAADNVGSSAATTPATD